MNDEPVTDLCCHRVEGTISESIVFFLANLDWLVEFRFTNFYDVIE